MDFRWCLRVVVIWLLSSQLKAAPHSGIRYLRVTKGGSVAIPITDGQCPESDFGLNTERKGPVVTYENNVPTEGPNYLGRIRLNNSNGCAVVISNVTKEDTETVYYPDGVLPGQPRIVLKMTSSTESSTTIAGPQQSSTTPGGSIESKTTTAAPQPSTSTTGLHVDHLAVLVPVGVGGVVVVVVVGGVVVCIRKCKNKKLNEDPPLAELQVLNQNKSMDTAEQ
ncbi:uncharacterized protein LOC115203376 [Salmo trutta]|uniref:uncharacterized protein LOC115203376 n=1 Tax=Salmo trutta TaxID=8032 RepID=UPI00113256F4|nr:uncharacterized protein LOC115203376 [Salmo trutta]